jgi:hypothetical protein
LLFRLWFFFNRFCRWLFFSFRRVLRPLFVPFFSFLFFFIYFLFFCYLGLGLGLGLFLGLLPLYTFLVLVFYPTFVFPLFFKYIFAFLQPFLFPLFL